MKTTMMVRKFNILNKKLKVISKVQTNNIVSFFILFGFTRFSSQTLYKQGQYTKTQQEEENRNIR